ncbi:MAG TPA: S46 family peptidase [Candidatus Cryptobacteroides excrementigallinarum]|nr:S46 family peptidase [Candidatus Cryptobacteroides excrementigallinarum]
MRNTLIALLAAAALLPSARADEGMWLPMLISQRIEHMHDKGFTLDAEDIYSINQASLKDAVVLFGGGCTGEVVSPEGLLFTNHHCGYSQIQKHSSVEHDYLKDGFWALERSDELPNPGLSVMFLEYMQDVTSELSSATDRQAAIDSLVTSAEAAGKGLSASVEEFYYGNQYFLFVYKEFRDVRLVGAPPSSIGKFGGDTDNWMWPRHTGDFSIFRIYAGPDNEPAGYSEDNVPYRPKKYFKIATGGVQEGDFTFIYGFPGSTREYVTSDEVRYIGEISDPAKIALRTMRLEIMKKYMDSSQDLRIRYSSKYANVSNAWKKWQGEAGGIARNGTVEEKEAYEARFAEWAAGTRYEGLLDRLDSLYKVLEPLNFAREYTSETALALELPKFATAYCNASEEDRAQLADDFYKDWWLPVDKECFIALMDAYSKDVPAEFRPACFDSSLVRYGSIPAWADAVFGGGLSKGELSDAANDPAYAFRKAFTEHYNNVLLPEYLRISDEITALYKDYMQGQMEFEPEKDFYPDANLTLRVAYGNVAGYSPSDGVYYKPVSTLTGIMEKDNPEIFDYDVPQKLRELYATGLYDDMPVCFIATNHTSGGNSGSPVIDADGNLIGLNFDRVWEGTMSDIAFDPAFCRNICLDIRYLLFVVDKVCGAGALLNELEFVE